jgi:hypothetical protein
LVALKDHAVVQDGWLSVQEAADRCGMAYRTMRAMFLRGELSAESPARSGGCDGRISMPSSHARG